MADYIFYGGDIVTMDESYASPEALAIKGSRIMAIGTQEEMFLLGGSETKYVSLADKQTLLPGFIEPHQHVIQMLRTRCMAVDCSGYFYNSYEEIRKLFKTTVAKFVPGSGRWCMFAGWDAELIPNLPRLSADLLDDLSSEFPVAVVGQNGHVAWVNHKALEIAEITNDTEDPVGGTLGRNQAGELTGELVEVPAIWMVIRHSPPPTELTLVEAIEGTFRDYARSGFTTVTDLGYVPQEKIDGLLCAQSQRSDFPVRVALYKVVYGPGEEEVEEPTNKVGIASEKEETPRAHDHTLSLDKDKTTDLNIEPNGKLWLAGVKVFGDGSPHCGTAATRKPYLDNEFTRMLGFPVAPFLGKLNCSDEHLFKTVKYWHERGKQIAIHAHGERCIDQVLNVYEKVRDRSFISS